MKNIKYLRLLGFAPIVIYMMIKKTLNLDFMSEMIIVSVLICTSLIVSVYLNKQKSNEEKYKKRLFLFVSISISVIVFLIQFF